MAAEGTSSKAPRQSALPIQELKAVKRVQLNEIIPPVDFSFLHITGIEECQNEEPRDTSPRKNQPTKKKHEKEKSDEKSQSMCLRLNNNFLKNINNISSIAASLFDNPANISWIDLSFNLLENIDPALIQFENLKILYLHGNNIGDMKEVNKLTSLKKLMKLTLHGNDIENIKGYRFFVLATLPNLINFDFSRVTKGDRVTATTFKGFYNPDKPKKIKHND
ncbi:unnamed protein product [Lymnaea stagnalis]|uniref:Leucine-rich repeat-containing protein 51 n=1 Tax=Lymnaea stagnalis TaxID=6523 RepID=A0AAV2HUV6_LYMST